MKRNKHMKTITSITYPVFALFAFACFALSPQARAQCGAVGCVDVRNTALGVGALLSCATTGCSDDTAVGYMALNHSLHGHYNTAIGSNALFFNTAGGSYNTATGSLALYNNTTG